jgi:serine/threonine-protein kinase HipA
MDVAQWLGLRVHARLTLRERALFIPRFDRVARGDTVTRLAQESIASLTGMPGLDALPSHDQVCLALIQHCTHPQEEVLEYIKRDVANLAMGDKDNHARNTAVQRDFAGRVALTPLYDFAPMYLHPDGIARRIRWEGNDGGQPDWRKVLDRVCGLGAQAPQKGRKKGPPPVLRGPLVQGLRAMAPRLERVAAEGAAMGLEADLLDFLRPGIERLARELATLD